MAEPGRRRPAASASSPRRDAPVSGSPPLPECEVIGLLVSSPSPRPGFSPGLFYWYPLSVGVKSPQYPRDGVDRRSRAWAG